MLTNCGDPASRERPSFSILPPRRVCRCFLDKVDACPVRALGIVEQSFTTHVTIDKDDTTFLKRTAHLRTNSEPGGVDARCSPTGAGDTGSRNGFRRTGPHASLLTVPKRGQGSVPTGARYAGEPVDRFGQRTLHRRRGLKKLHHVKTRWPFARSCLPDSGSTARKDLDEGPLDGGHRCRNINDDIDLGAIGFDWFSASDGGVSWLISRPRKKLITPITANKQYAMVA